MTEPLVVVAPDKFKGTLSAPQVAHAIATGIRRGRPEARVTELPMADGGEGTVDLLRRHGWHTRKHRVNGPLGTIVEATWVWRDHVAVIEAASACGLGLLGTDPTPATALEATSSGVGQLIRRAAEEGATYVIVGVGGTACTDGGAGAVRALPPNGLPGVTVRVACDVSNVLLGPTGAAATYAPQKGADPSAVEQLERRLEAWAAASADTTLGLGRDLTQVPGSGAGGGLAFGLASALGAEIVPGLQTILGLAGAEATIGRADHLVVGEGCLDYQSLFGKGPIALAQLAVTSTSVTAVVGRSAITAADARAAGIHHVHSLVDRAHSVEHSMRHSRELLEEAGVEIARRISRDRRARSPDNASGAHREMWAG